MDKEEFKKFTNDEQLPLNMQLWDVSIMEGNKSRQRRINKYNSNTVVELFYKPISKIVNV